jgi:predicted transcriptional regulator
MTWQRLGPREKQVLAILRRGEGTVPAREVLETLEAEGADLAYTTVSTVLDRLATKGVLDRTTEVHGGSRRYRYAFDPEHHADEFVECVVGDVRRVLGDDGLDRLVERATEQRQPSNP